LPEDDERRLIAESLASLERATGTRPRGWLSIARSQSWNTPRLLAEAGVDYCCDWPNDELPFEMSTDAGPLIALPSNHELSDRQILAVQQQSVDSYAEQMRDAYSWLDAEAQQFGGRMLPLHLTPLHHWPAVPHRSLRGPPGMARGAAGRLVRARGRDRRRVEGAVTLAVRNPRTGEHDYTIEPLNAGKWRRSRPG
jgi:hypothetical protein